MDASVELVVDDVAENQQPGVVGQWFDGGPAGAHVHPPRPVDGEAAPEGYSIKGNQSKKYHVPGSTWYEQTTPEYWFDTVESAKAAGFEPAGGEARQQIKNA